MKITINKKDLLTELNLIKQTIDMSSKNPVLSTVLFRLSADNLNEMNILATDQELFIRTTVKVEGKEAGEFCLPADKLIGIAKVIDDEDIILDSKKDAVNNTYSLITLKGNKNKYNIQPYPASHFPATPKIADTTITIKPKELLTALKKVNIAVTSIDNNKFAIKGLKIDVDGYKITLAATDGNILGVAELSCINEGDNWGDVLPRKAINQLISLLDTYEDGQVLECSRTENRINFKIGNKRLSTLKLATSFPNYGSIIPKSYTKNIPLNKDEFIKAIKAVSVMNTNTQESIRLTLFRDLLKIESRDDTGGNTASSIIGTKWDSDDKFQIHVNATFLLSILNVIDSKDIDFNMNESLTPISVVGQNINNYFHLLMPMRPIEYNE